MKNFIKQFIQIVVALVLVAGMPVFVFAANLEVDFETEPLFEEFNFLPSESVTKTVEVTNNSESSQNVIVESINAVDEDGLGDVLILLISEGEDVLYDDTLGKFLTDGEVVLSTLSSGESKVYVFDVSFETGAGNEYQNGVLGFDLCIGFEGGDTHCGDTVVGGEGNTEEEGVSGEGGTITGSGDGNGGGGGGGIIPSTPLTVLGESVVESDLESGTALIEWDSNFLATSKVVYGPESGAPYTLNLSEEPNFGYPLGTVEDQTKVTHHSVLLTGLTPGESYRFRVVSRASPPTVGFEYVFKFSNDFTSLAFASPFSGTAGGRNVSSGNNAGLAVADTETAGVLPSGTVSESEDNDGADETSDIYSGSQTAAVGGLFNSFKEYPWRIMFLLLLFVAVIIFFLFSKKRKKV